MYKQIIIARRDLEMSPGKLAAQVSHASMAFLTTTMRRRAKDLSYDWLPCVDNNGKENWYMYRNPDVASAAKKAWENGQKYFKYSSPMENENYYRVSFKIEHELFDDWIKGSFTKCVLGARNKNKLMKAVEIAESLGMKEGVDYFLIRDNCNTELEPEDEDGRTLTCVGFKPMPEEIIDQIGKKFHLY